MLQSSKNTRKNTKVKNLKISKILLLSSALLSVGFLGAHPIPLGLQPLVAQENTTSQSSSQNPSQKPEKFEYPQEVTRTFMRGCGFTNSREFCTCSLDGLRSQYDFATFLKIDQAARETKQVPQEVINIFQSCRPKTSSS